MANFVVLVGDDDERPVSRITLVKNVTLISRAVEEFNPHEPSTSTAALAADVAKSSERRTTATFATSVERTPVAAAAKTTTLAAAVPVVSPTTATVAPVSTAAPPSSTVQTTSENAGFFAAPTSKTVSSKKYIYTNLNDCDQISKKYNVWGVITKVSREPSPTKGTRLMAQVYIQDTEYQGSYGHSDYQFSILSSKLEEFPPLSVGAVIRIHHMQVQEWNGSKNGRVYDGRCVAVIPGKVNEPIIPKFTSLPSEFEFNEADEAKVQTLRLWWAEYKRQRDLEAETPGASEKKICEVKQACFFDLRCKILRIFHTKMRERKVSVLRVTDGTNSVGHAVICVEEEADDDVRFQCASDGQRYIDIFVKENSDWLQQIQEDSFVLFKRVECAEEQLFDSDKTVRLSAFRFTISEGFSFLALPSNHSTLRELRRIIESDGPQQPQEDLGLMELLDQINDSPNKLTCSTMSADLC
jgi:hypothetical protein